MASRDHPLYQVMLVVASTMLSPTQPEIGTNGTFLLDFVETLFTVFWLGGVHLVDGDNHLLDTKGESEKGVFTSLSVLGDTGFEFTGTGSDDKDGAISLGGSSDH